MKKKVITCLVGVSVFTCGTASFADSSNVLQDSNGGILNTGKAYCIRPTVLVNPKLNITVGDSGYTNLNDSSSDCQYAYKLVGDDRVNNRAVIAGETVRFEEMKKEFDGTYRKTNNFLKASSQYIHSSENEYFTRVEGIRMPHYKKIYEFAKFKLAPTNNAGSEMNIKYNGNYVWKTPFTVTTGVRWIELQDQNNGTGVTTFEFKPVK